MFIFALDLAEILMNGTFENILHDVNSKRILVFSGIGERIRVKISHLQSAQQIRHFSHLACV